jgi:predicted helicase
MSEAMPKLNRKQRRANESFSRRANSRAITEQQQRLENFRVLLAWKEDNQNELSSEEHKSQIDSVFRVALDRLFKGRKIVRNNQVVSFEAQLNSILRNVQKGFKYKNDIAPPVEAAP